jgi:hypothetical protein
VLAEHLCHVLGDCHALGISARVNLASFGHRQTSRYEVAVALRGTPSTFVTLESHGTTMAVTVTPSGNITRRVGEEVSSPEAQVSARRGRP